MPIRSKLPWTKPSETRSPSWTRVCSHHKPSGALECGHLSAQTPGRKWTEPTAGEGVSPTGTHSPERLGMARNIPPWQNNYNRSTAPQSRHSNICYRLVFCLRSYDFICAALEKLQIVRFGYNYCRQPAAQSASILFNWHNSELDGACNYATLLKTVLSDMKGRGIQWVDFSHCSLLQEMTGLTKKCVDNNRYLSVGAFA